MKELFVKEHCEDSKEGWILFDTGERVEVPELARISLEFGYKNLVDFNDCIARTGYPYQQLLLVKKKEKKTYFLRVSDEPRIDHNYHYGDLWFLVPTEEVTAWYEEEKQRRKDPPSSSETQQV